MCRLLIWINLILDFTHQFVYSTLATMKLIGWLKTVFKTSCPKYFYSYGDVTMSGERRHNLITRRDLYRATSAVTRDLGFFSLTGRAIYTVTFYDKQEILRIITKFTWLSFLLCLFSTLNGYWNKTVKTERPFYTFFKIFLDFTCVHPFSGAISRWYMSKIGWLKWDLIFIHFKLYNTSP